MDNKQLTELLARFADLLDIKGESGFRVNAYRRAADTIKRYDGSIAERVQQGTVTDIKGIGKGIAANLNDIVVHQEFRELNDLQDEIPATLLTILAIPGVGPKSVGRLYRELSITNLEDLEHATRQGLVATLKGMGKSQEKKILDGIAFLRQRTGRLSIGTALPAARNFSHQIAESLGVRVEIAGSARRVAETVGDINLVVEHDDADAVANAIRDVLRADIEISVDRNFISFKHPLFCPINIVLASREDFGGVWFRRTGSEAHVRSLEESFSLPDVTMERETDVYDTAGVSWIPPELREDRGEIDSARTGALPELVAMSDIKGDVHLHSNWSDGRATIEELSSRAAQLGYEYLAIADHSKSLAIANGLTSERLVAQAELIDRVNQEAGKVRLLRASEVEILRDGSLDFPDEVLERLDLVVASLHSGRDMSSEDLTRRLLTAIENPHVDVIGHPLGRIIEQRPGAEYDWKRVFDAAARTQTALEINANPARLDLPEDLAREAVAAGVLISIDSDAHDLDGLNVMEFGVGIARRAWVPAASVVNTWPLEKLLDWLSR